MGKIGNDAATPPQQAQEQALNAKIAQWQTQADLSRLQADAYMNQYNSALPPLQQQQEMVQQVGTAVYNGSNRKAFTEAGGLVGVVGGPRGRPGWRGSDRHPQRSAQRNCPPRLTRPGQTTVHMLELVSQSGTFNDVLVVGVVLVALAGVYLASRVDVTVLLVAALALELFSGNWGLMGLPGPLDRVAMAVALGALVLKGTRNVGARRLVLRPLHLALLSALAWCVASGLIAGTITHSLGFYAFLDRFGFFPFLLFCLAPIFFGTPRQRNILLVGLVGMGLYLGYTGCMEGLHIWKLVFPHYIANPNVGIQWGRARGPFLESTGDGFCTFVCGTGAVIGLKTWSRRVHWVCYLTIGLDFGHAFLHPHKRRLDRHLRGDRRHHDA